MVISDPTALSRLGSAAEAVVTVRDVLRTYGEGRGAVTALRKVTFEVSAGSLVAITGRSGSGKTTLLNLIGGIDTPSSGTILLAGRDITRLNEHERTTLRRHGIAFIFQSFALLPTLSALENVMLALHIARVPLRERTRRGRELSGGEQERAAIARALAGRAPLILADEPTGELDTATGRDIIGLLTDVVRTQQVAVIVATHDPAVVAAADRAYGLVDGILHSLEGRNASGA
jgi:putative ABC transport system ATP-binding protein